MALQRTLAPTSSSPAARPHQAERRNRSTAPIRCRTTSSPVQLRRKNGAIRERGRAHAIGLRSHFGRGIGFEPRARYLSSNSVISMAWSAAMSRKTWVVPLVGQVTVSSVTRRRVAQADRLDQRVAAEAAVVADRPVDRPRAAVGRPSGRPRILAPRAERLVLVPTSLTFSQCRPWPGFWNRTL